MAPQGDKLSAVANGQNDGGHQQQQQQQRQLAKELSVKIGAVDHLHSYSSGSPNAGGHVAWLLEQEGTCWGVSACEWGRRPAPKHKGARAVDPEKQASQ